MSETVQDQKQKLSGADTMINKVTCKGFKSFQRKTSIPLFEGLTAVVGENGNGKCVTGDTEVTLADGTEKKIRDIVEPKIDEDAQKIDDGYISYADNDRKVISLNKDTLKTEKRNILAYAKREAPKNILKIKTRSGRTINATKDHPLFKLDKNGEVEAVDSENIRKGERIATPRSLDIDNDSDIFTELLDSFEREDGLYVPYKQEFEDIMRQKKQQDSLTWKQMSEKLDVSHYTIRGLKEEQACNFASLVKILRGCGKEDKEIKNLITSVKAKNSSKTCKMVWKNSREFSRLLGYLLAEGQVPKSNCQIRFTNSKENILDNYEELFSKIFELETHRKHYEENCGDILVYNSAAGKILEKFGLSREGSGEKTVSSIYLKNSSKEHISGLIEGLYAGDGYVSWNAIELTTKSPKLSNKLQSLLARLGIVSRIQEKKKTAASTGTANKYYQVTITGSENVNRFKENISIPHTLKQQRMKELSQRHGNTNIDLVEANGLVQKVVDNTSVHPHSRENRSEIPKLGTYYSEKCLPSRKGLRQVTRHIHSETQQEDKIEKLQRLAKSDIYWDEITSIEKKKPEEDWVYDLNIAVNHNFVANNTFIHNSNILDGISFVFGRRSSNLRAEKMTQLIFNGGENRKAADYAKVTVYLDNSSGIFDEFLEEEEEANEITVARKITQAGSSMYKFQGTNCKKSRIDEIADKANIDPEGYHFVRQGKVTEIVEQSDTERRKVVDELSGVAKFDEKKEEAEEELEEVEQKLQEQEILLNEKKQQVEKLREEKELAIQYRELEERKSKLEASILEVRKRTLSNELANLNTDVSGKKEKIEELEEELEKIDEKIDEKNEKLDELDEKDTGGGDVQHLENKIEKKRGQIENKREKVEDLEEQIEELEKMKNRRNTGSKAVDSVLSMGDDNIIGAFQDLISAEERLSIAIETAAGGHMNDVVVEDKDTAMKAINYLKRESIGRARMLPMDKISTRSKSAKSQMAKKRKGVLGYASELVDFNTDYEKAINHVFSDTLIAEDLESVKDVNGVRVVTLDGDVMSRGGSMSGGAKKRKRSGKNKKLSKSLDPEAKKKKKKQVKEEIQDLQKDIAELKDMKDRKEDEEDEDSSGDIKQQRKDIRNELSDLRDDRQEKYSELQNLKTKVDQEGGRKARLKAELDNVKEDLKEKMEEHEFSKDDLTGLDSSPEDLKKKKKKVLRKQNSMGPVNMRAIDSFKEKKEEYDDFKDKVSQIRREKLEIEDMVEEIESKRRECFMETLEKLKKSFSRIFTNLFDGGNAELELEEDDIDKGLKIRAAPPKKDPHIIQALSGGEKTMTAIAFVFAILEYEESPFYIMDEIDAALDKKNSKKLGDILAEYAEDNQFIVISHNEITVRHAERAYGVSMSEGVSQMRSIELDV